MRSVLRLAVAAAAVFPTMGLAQTVATPLPRGVMAPVAMRDMTPAEARAHATWSLRAALNVAALQCQFSPFLRTVKNYNLMLPYHGAEFTKAIKTLNDHFKRYDGPDGSKVRQAFDQYTTRTYNSFSTLDAQLSFCDKASEVGWEALKTSRGAFADLAASRLPEIRASLLPTSNPLFATNLGWVSVAPIANPCLDRRGKPIPVPSKKCR